MTPRGQQVLHEIVEAYIATGEPVASRSIARRRRDGLSAASIRNVMADLDEEGYLIAAPYFGRPRSHRKSVPQLRPVVEHAPDGGGRNRAAALPNSGGCETVEQRVEYTSRMLTEMTHGVGIAAAIPQASPALEQMELVALPDRRVLMVVVTRDHQVRNRVVTLEEALIADELSSIRNYINRNFAGWTLEDVRRELAGRLAHAEATYDAILQKLTVLYSKGLLDIGIGAGSAHGRRQQPGGPGPAPDQGENARAVPRAGREEARAGAAGPFPRTARRRNRRARRAGRNAPVHARAFADRRCR